MRGWRRIGVLFIAGAAVNYAWEVAQSPLYRGMGNLAFVLTHCFSSALGDGALVLLVYTAAAAVQGSSDWYHRPSSSAIVAALLAGLIIGVAVELWGLGTGRWQYADAMPTLPGAGVGIVPVLQMLVLPSVVFWIASKLDRQAG